MTTKQINKIDPNKKFEHDHAFNQWHVMKFVNRPSNRVVQAVVMGSFATLIAVAGSGPFVMINQKVRSIGSITSELGVRQISALRAGTFRRLVLEDAVVKEGDLLGHIEIKGLNRESGEKLSRAFQTLSQLTEPSGQVQNNLNPTALVPTIEVMRRMTESSEWANVEGEISLNVMDVLNHYDTHMYQIRAIQKATNSETLPLRSTLAKADEKIRRLNGKKKNRDLAFFTETIAEDRRRLASQIAQVENAYRLRTLEADRELRNSIKKSAVQVSLFLSNSEVRAPIAGRLYRWNVPDKVQVPAGGAAVAQVLPSTSRVISRLIVKSNDQPKLLAGQKVFLKLESFPYHQFGVFEGEVIDVKPVSELEGGYAVTTTIQPKERVPASSFPIGSGVSADIVIGERSMFATVFEKLFPDWR